MDIDRNRVQEDYDYYRGRVAKLEGSADNPVRAYGLFDAALTAAGFGRAVGKPAAELQSDLEIAARAAISLFGMPRGDDTSAQNPDTFVRAAYAALVAGGAQELDALAQLPAAAYHTDQFEVSPEFDAYALALQRVLADDADGARASVADARNAHDAGVAAQAQALDALLRGDRGEYEQSLKRLVGLHLDADPRESATHLRLPVLGLQALATRLGVE
jgi:hypothetical protein